MSKPGKQLIENVQLIINDTKPEYQAEEVSQYIIDLINKARKEGYDAGHAQGLATGKLHVMAEPNTKPERTLKSKQEGTE